MRMVKQKPASDGSVALDCAVCVIAMLTDLPYEKVLADNPSYRTTSDHGWMRYLNLLGFQSRRWTKLLRHWARDSFCAIAGNVDGRTIPHAIAVDEEGRIFDPANGAPEPGAFTVAQCVAHETFKIHSCFTVRDRRSM